MSEEVWKDIETIPYHQVSNLGRVRVLPGGTVRYRLITEIELRKSRITDHGYVVITQGRRALRVHRLVLETFVGPCPLGMECRHLNGNRSDNRWPENLAWGTLKENQRDRIRHGTDNRGERSGNCKLTESQVMEIRVKPGPSRELAAFYGVSHTEILQIRRGKKWKHI